MLRLRQADQQAEPDEAEAAQPAEADSAEPALSERHGLAQLARRLVHDLHWAWLVPCRPPAEPLSCRSSLRKARVGVLRLPWRQRQGATRQ